jgi:hypothetical protein
MDELGTSERPASLAEAWRELKSNTLRKTFPQLLLAVWFCGLVLERHHING